MRYFVRLAALIGCILGVVAVSPATAQRRLALSVGIDKYENLPATAQLKKAVSDARAMGAALAELGFDAKVEENLTLDAFNDAWASFLNRLKPGDTAAFFFAGHGVQVQGANYLVPKSVPKVEEGKEKVLIGASIRFADLMKELADAGARVSLFIIDACRDNPFPANAYGRFVGGGARGLRREEAVVKGSFILYSAGYGEQALDRLSESDTDANSPYTRTLIQILKTPGLSLPEIARRVRAQVLELTAKQTPAYYDEVVGDFVLKPAKGSDPVGLTPGHPAPVVPAAPAATADLAWSSVKDSDDIATLELFRQLHGKERPLYDRLAARRIESLKEQRIALLKPEEARKKAEEDAKRDPALTVTPGSGKSFRDRTKDGQPCPECPEMVVVPAGSFMMGSPPAACTPPVWDGKSLLQLGHCTDYLDSERPQHKVTIARAFGVGKFEVTFAEWDACVAAGGCQRRPDDAGWGRGKRPVINVSWKDSVEYVSWLSTVTGKAYRLLTEAEWEYAARAGSTTRFHFGDNDGELCPYGNFADLAHKRGQKFPYDYGDTCEDGYVYTAPVGSFKPNLFGLYDMHGNVWEWVQDCRNSGYSGAPTDGSASRSKDCGFPMFRGGSWGSESSRLRSAQRMWDITANRGYTVPEHYSRSREHIGGYATSIGFRVARTL